ncbi:receptor protein-tyrosine kinase [Noviherbaspirillum humi]|uniref:Receptor protein-tyrosine kinase n=1 Tax=Noviherbaspirillum humi TaxID=1688639 RepID=A0A239GW90_9BURK|nr:polysaccharide biosynthesis tyrosine autokinase [Noviherbaspirillum humi]SNS73125.1 receptor protein-tyrosine kinase [Noviherbaspirillum humi]
MTTPNYLQVTTDENVSEIFRRPSRPIGTILVDAGRLESDDIENICVFQQKSDCLFGEAAVRMGLLSETDVAQALLRQFDCGYLVRGRSRVHHEVFAAYEMTSGRTEILRRLRSSILACLAEHDNDERVLSIISAHRMEGRSILAANLAVLFSQLGKRTLLIDADFRHPRQHSLFGIDNKSGLSSVLAGRVSLDVLRKVEGLDYLAILPAGICPPNPSELLERPIFSLVLNQLVAQFDMILVDTPAYDLYGDAHSVSRHGRNALVVVKDGVGQIDALRSLMADSMSARVNVIGSVLNTF